MATVVFDPALFRLQCPAFADPVKYPDVVLTMYWDDMVVCFIDPTDYGFADIGCKQSAMNLMLAHILELAKLNTGGVGGSSKQGGYKTSATVDKVSVAYLAPPTPDQSSWWLNQTTYGQQLLALLDVWTVGGLSAGGLPERRGFRKYGGTFL